MTGAPAPRTERRACLTPLGEVAALGIRLRNSVPGLSELDQRRLSLELRQLVEQYCPRPQRVS
jgi:hypothetical protein